MTPRVRAGEIELGCRIWGDGPIPVLFIHGNLASKEWIELAARWLPGDLKVIGLDWRGCGDSDKPEPVADFANYAMQQHAEDMIAALDSLEIGRCHLATHSTGGLIANRMQLLAPERFGRVLALDPVSPFGLAFDARTMDVFRAMQADRSLFGLVMSGVAPSLFRPESLASGAMPEFRPGSTDEAALFERILEISFAASDGIWLGTPHNLNAEHLSGEVAARMSELTHETLVLWGQLDGVIPLADMERMATGLPNCRLVRVPGIGHSMCLEAPALFAGYLGAIFSGRPV